MVSVLGVTFPPVGSESNLGEYCSPDRGNPVELPRGSRWAGATTARLTHTLLAPAIPLSFSVRFCLFIRAVAYRARPSRRVNRLFRLIRPQFARSMRLQKRLMVSGANEFIVAPQEDIRGDAEQRENWAVSFLPSRHSLRQRVLACPLILVDFIRVTEATVAQKGNKRVTSQDNSAK